MRSRSVDNISSANLFMLLFLQASTLETVIYLLEDMDLPPSPAKKTSRELSGTLRNLKKIEQALEMMKKLMDSHEILED